MGRTVLIIDDHAAFRTAVRALLEAGDFEVVGEAEDGAAAIAAAAELRPDIAEPRRCLTGRRPADTKRTHV